MKVRDNSADENNYLSNVTPHFAAGLRTHALRAGQLPFSSHSSSGSTAALVLRRRIHGSIVNAWLIAIAALGAVIAAADGLTRAPISEREASWNGPLEYQPYLGAVLLAALTIPLVFGYARRARIGLTEGLLLWFVFCTAAYTRDFAYIHVPGAPLFVTDIVLVALLLLLYSLARPMALRAPVALHLFVGLFVAAGVLAALRGFLQHRETAFVLRDAALVAYSLFLYVAHQLLPSWLAIKRLAVWFLLGTGLSAVNGLGWFLAAPQERRFIYYGTYILIALVGTLVAIANRLLPQRTGWSLAVLFLVGLTVANARSLFVALPILLLLGLATRNTVRDRIQRHRMALATVATAALLIGFLSFLFLRTQIGRELAERSADELASGVLHSGEDTNWRFRLSAWQEAWKRFAEYPLAGEGYGIPFVFDLLPLDNDPRPHNTFLTVLYKMGFLGFLPLAFLLVYFFWTVIRAVHRSTQSRRASLLWIVVLSQLAFCFYGAANLLLESPFLASLFWLSMGLGFRMARMLELERTTLRLARAH